MKIILIFSMHACNGTLEGDAEDGKEPRCHFISFETIVRLESVIR